ncbi:hypothetical protein PC122_g18335 [Phytophthora cactorum]|nr:hypothetical protein PC122_g18335 [Phytophthora cactorum]
MVQVTLVCVDVKSGSVNVVDIDTEKLVGHLQQAIAEVLKYSGKASDLQLFLAKKANGAWLSSPSEDVKKLKKGVKTALIKALTKEDQELQAEDPLEDVLIGMDPPSARQIHVLVVVPQQWTSAPIVSDGVSGAATVD